ncbi:mismatch-specific DNA-glycosylase [Paenibacillus sp. IB182496]|uniref:Mismatch-specific DNA-glycosylase n=1 Tax=Paenibacillus sabuli TaxID=2772509 RepID=A0A927GTP0_9BACL|nr:mismatch-specific DNA-glycosylase [Paenibacillus sabuli]MBD2847818.1 mismatch-specific DNA-glycosylase [Paenibacillus sabuli]
MRGSTPDHLGANMNLLFVGFNPSLRSGETGHHYANPHNRFWRILHEAGLTVHRHRPEEDGDLLAAYGYGFTNIVARPTRTAAEITKAEYREGARLLAEKLNRYRPRVACYVGKGVYEQLTASRPIPWGVQTRPVVPGVLDFVAPSSSGLVRMPIDEVITIYRQLPALLD